MHPNVHRIRLSTRASPFLRTTSGDEWEQLRCPSAALCGAKKRLSSCMVATYPGFNVTWSFWGLAAKTNMAHARIQVQNGISGTKNGHRESLHGRLLIGATCSWRLPNAAEVRS